VKNLTSYGKEVFVSEIWFPSHYDPEVYFDWGCESRLLQRPPVQLAQPA